MSYDPSHRKPPRQERWPQATPPEGLPSYRDGDVYRDGEQADSRYGADHQGAYPATAGYRIQSGYQRAPGEPRDHGYQSAVATDTFPPARSGYGSVGAYGAADGYGDGRDGYDWGADGYGGSGHGYADPETGYGAAETGYGAAETGYGAAGSGFRAAGNGYGGAGNDDSYRAGGYPSGGYAGGINGYAGGINGYAGAADDFAGTASGYDSSRNGYTGTIDGYPGAADDFPGATDGFDGSANGYRRVEDDYGQAVGEYPGDASGYGWNENGYDSPADGFAGPADGFAGYPGQGYPGQGYPGQGSYAEPASADPRLTAPDVGVHPDSWQADQDRRREASQRGLVVGAVTGFLAAAVAIGVSTLTAAFVRPQASPTTVVGSVFIDRTPAVLKNFAVQHFGPNDRTVLLLGMYAMLAFVALGVGMLARREAALGVAAIAAFSLVGAFVAITRPESRVTDVTPSVVGGLAGVAALLWLVRASAPVTPVRYARGGSRRRTR